MARGEEPLPSKLSLRQLSQITGVSGQNINHMVKAGDVEKTGHGWYPLIAVQQVFEASMGGDLREELLKERVGKIKDERERIQIGNAKERGELIEVAKVEEDGLKIAQAVKAGHRALRSRLPPALSGLEASEMEKVIEAATDELDRELSDLAGEFYREPEPAKPKRVPAKRKLVAVKKKRTARK